VRLVGVLVLALLVELVARRPVPATTGSLFLSTLGCRLELRSQDPRTRALLEVIYGALRVPAAPSPFRFTVVREGAELLLDADGQLRRVTKDEDELLAALDEAVVVQLQRRRPDLFFVHSAVLELGGRAVLLVAPSGTGKSTTAWALSHHGFRYLSDELAPIDPGTLRVHPFPRALHLKATPPARYPLSPAASRTGRSIHVAPGDLPGGVCRDSQRLGAVVFLHRARGTTTESIRPVSAAEAAATLLANALNPLAHRGDGLDPAVAVARSTPCFSLALGDVDATCHLLKRTIERR
jgi:hypothetical protein